MTSRFILNKFDLDLSSTGLLILWFLLLVIVVAAALCGVLVVYEAVLGYGWGRDLLGEMGLLILCLLLR